MQRKLHLSWKISCNVILLQTETFHLLKVFVQKLS